MYVSTPPSQTFASPLAKRLSKVGGKILIIKTKEILNVNRKIKLEQICKLFTNSSDFEKIGINSGKSNFQNEGDLILLS